jgi:metallophosphoesterase (TIGR00282 family)
MLKVLMVGDVISKSGRDILKKYLNAIIIKYQTDFVIINGENVTHGKGINKETYNKLISYGADAITLGNHAFRKDVSSTLFESPSLIRPYNIHKTAPGVGTRVFDVKGIKVRVTNLLGQVFITDLNPTNPFDALDEIINSSSEKVHIVDFHAQATGEKLALAWAFDGKVSAVLGTHTHVQTADERLLTNKTAYISDVGMCGAYNSVIGSKQNEVIYRSWTGLPASFDVAIGEGQLNAVVVSIDEITGSAISIERVMINPEKVVGF